MGTKKQWTGREKIAIVLEGLKGECRISELCNEHGILQGMCLQMGEINCLRMEPNYLRGRSGSCP